MRARKIKFPFLQVLRRNRNQWTNDDITCFQSCPEIQLGGPRSCVTCFRGLNFILRSPASPLNLINIAVISYKPIVRESVNECLLIFLGRLDADVPGIEPYLRLNSVSHVCGWL